MKSSVATASVYENTVTKASGKDMARGIREQLDEVAKG